MKIFLRDQIRQIDEYTIRNEPVPSASLMERAAARMCDWYIERFSTLIPVIVFAGTGNNGGDGLAMARMLYGKGYQVTVYFAGITGNATTDWKINRNRLEKETKVVSESISDTGQMPVIPGEAVIIDSLFGSGLSRPVTGIAAEIIKKINASGCTVISVDIPSGLFCEDNTDNDFDCIVKASYTLSLQFPKLSFMFPENEKFTGSWHVLPIGLHEVAIESTESPYRYLDMDTIRPMIRKRKKFDHKGDFGHGMLVGGTYGRMGAVVLGARAALRSGTGLVTCHIPACGNLIMQCAVPEAMAVHDKSVKFISSIGDTKPFSAVGIGPGMGTAMKTQKTFHEFLMRNNKPLVIDADALNILAENKPWLKELRGMSVLTPHPGEFSRLAGESPNGFKRLRKQIEFSSEYNCIVVLKGANTSITEPEGNIWFNSTGNPGMATAGSGDTLTGIILSLLAQKYSPVEAALAGVFIHGLAGDIASERLSFESLIATDIIDRIGDAFNRIRTG
jgi:NAD(P)H-hydrate epimerase